MQRLPRIPTVETKRIVHGNRSVQRTLGSGSVSKPGTSETPLEYTKYESYHFPVPDSKGRLRHPKGSPNSIGGRFAKKLTDKERAQKMGLRTYK